MKVEIFESEDVSGCTTCSSILEGSHIVGKFEDGPYSSGGFAHFCGYRCLAHYMEVVAALDAEPKALRSPPSGE